MSIFIVNNIPFNYPDPGEQPGGGDASIGYGEDATAWAAEVTSVLNSILAPGDLLETTATIANDVSAALDISGMVFSISVVRAANIDYTIIRSVSTPASLIESGTLYATYNTVTSVWYLSQTQAENAGVIFTITPAGQVQYTSSDMVGAGYSGEITFKARTLSQ